VAWPTAVEVEQRTGVSLTNGVTSYGLSVTSLLQSVRDACEAYCGRDFSEDEVTEVFDGGTVLTVRRPPIVAVDELLYRDEELTEDEDFYVYPHYIKIGRSSIPGLGVTQPSREAPRVFTLTYTGGYSDADGVGHVPIPSDLKEIILEFACRELLKIEEQYRGAKGASSYQVGSYSVTFGAWNRVRVAGEPAENADLFARLARYKLVEV